MLNMYKIIQNLNLFGLKVLKINLLILFYIDRLLKNLENHRFLLELIVDQLHFLMEHIILKFNIGPRRDFLLLKSIMEDHQDLAKHIERD